MKKLKVFLLLLCLTVSTVVYAQNVTTKTIEWKAETLLDAAEGNWIDEKTSFITYGGTRCEWRNADGSIRQTFTIAKIKGTWTNPAEDGKVKYEVTSGSDKGIVTLRNKHNQLTVLIVISSSENPAVYELPIESFAELKPNAKK